MKTILVINNATPEASHAARFALVIAQKLQANLLLANTTKTLSAIKVLTDGSLAIDEENNMLKSLETLQAIPITIEPLDSLRVLSAVSRLAQMHRLTVYDAMYLELAARLGIPMATRDSDLAKAATVARVPLWAG